jgi:hypothetical protein
MGRPQTRSLWDKTGSKYEAEQSYRLGYYAMSDESQPTFRWNLSPPSNSKKPAWGRCNEERLYLLPASFWSLTSILKMEAVSDLHGIIGQQIEMFIVSAVRSSNLTKWSSSISNYPSLTSWLNSPNVSLELCFSTPLSPCSPVRVRDILSDKFYFLYNVRHFQNRGSCSQY